MSDTLTIENPDAMARQGQGIIDCDIHPSMTTPDELMPFLSQRWRTHMATYGNSLRQGLANTLSHPRMTPEVARADAWPPNGGPPGSDVQFMREQHLDAHGIRIGVLVPLRGTPGNQRNLDFGIALASAVNEWQVDKFCGPEPRLKASLVVTQEDPAAAVAEIEKRAGDARYAQILLPPRSTEPLGRRRYWPIYEAATAANLPIAMHVGGIGGHPATGAGWPSYYIEEHHSQVQTMQALLASFIFEGVFARFPTLRIAFVEGGFGWAPAFSWRMDRAWEKMRDEVPHLRRPPSEYLRENVWFTTQPMEEPFPARNLRDTLNWIGTDRLMFSTDYPHWDFDDPAHAFKIPLEDEERQAIFSGNAARFYGWA
ncbi:amidohydrolase family protein [Mesorhizobium sp. CAU 1741]|uniref:amidohydrolase family protein n=1 Tax=Mesorhizobium sp. CAU 1741 TaxID=3140366 RepID=UPI00325B97FE